MNKWLKEEIVEYPCEKYDLKYNSKIYYTAKEDEKINRNLIKENTRHHNINCLFNHLVNYSMKNNIIGNDKLPIINSSYKRQFLKFVYDSSNK